MKNKDLKNSKKQDTKRNNACTFPRECIEYDCFNCDFDGGDMRAKPLGTSYKYVHTNIFYRAAAFFLYRCIATPAAFIYTKLFMHEKIHGKRALKKCKGGYFIYGNHTQPISDAFTPNTVSFPKRCYVVISTKNFSLPVLGPVLPMLGGLPLPDSFSTMRSFTAAIKKRAEAGGAIAIYPEAHLWPFCTFIRPFGDESFEYPVSLDLPSFTYTRVYRPRGKKSFRCDVYIDGPFYPDKSLPKRQARRALCDAVYSAMQSRAEENGLEVIRYSERRENPAENAENAGEVGGTL